MNTKIVILGLVSSLVVGCQTQSYLINGGGGVTPTKSVNQTFFVSGLAQTQEMDAAAVCGGADRVARIETQQTFLNGLLGSLSQGIYTPRQMRVMCK